MVLELFEKVNPALKCNKRGYLKLTKDGCFKDEVSIVICDQDGKIISNAPYLISISLLSGKYRLHASINSGYGLDLTASGELRER